MRSEVQKTSWLVPVLGTLVLTTSAQIGVEYFKNEQTKQRQLETMNTWFERVDRESEFCKWTDPNKPVDGEMFPKNCINMAGQLACIRK